MEYGKIVSVTGLPGLFELVSSKNDGAIVRSLDDKVTRFVSSRIHNFSHLESIEIYTVRDNVNLVDVFNAMEKSGEKLPDGKDNGLVKKYFEAVYPDLDFERVYTSDMKKIIKWFSILASNKIEIKLTELPEEEAAEEPVAAAPAVEEKAPKAKKEKKEEEAEEKPAKKAPAKAAAKKEKAEETGEEGEEKPKKKAAPKAKKETEEKPKEPAKKKAASAEKKPKK